MFIELLSFVWSILTYSHIPNAILAVEPISTTAYLGAAAIGALPGLINQLAPRQPQQFFSPESRQSLQMSAPIAQQLQAGTTGFGGQTQNFQNLLSTLQAGAASQALPGQRGFDPISQGLLGRGEEARRASLLRGSQAIQRQLGMTNPGLAAAMQRVGGMTSDLGANAARFDIAAQQQARDVQNAQIAQALRQEQAQLGTSSLGAQQNLLGALGQVGQLTGQQVTSQATPLKVPGSGGKAGK